ncbi:MAG: GAF domain-containing sensor histidine kinase [Herpetosiphon sp.]
MPKSPLLELSQLERRNRELSILNTITAALNRSVQLEQTLQAALLQVTELLNVDTGWVWLLRPDKEDFYLAASLNLPDGLCRHPELMEGSCYCLDTYRAGDLAGAANINVVTCSRLKKLVDDADGLRYHASIPLYAHKEQLGVLNVASTDWRELGVDELRMLHTIGDVLGIAIERAQLFDRSAQLGAVEERNRLARELHDTLAQGLTAALLQLEAADALLESNVERAGIQSAIQRAILLTRANVEETRRSVLDLRAAPLEGRTLAEALERLTTVTGEGSGIATRLTVTGASHPLSGRVEVGLYRIAQEGLTNVVRHASACSITLDLAISPGEARLVVEDDGVGFDPQASAQGHYGLIGLNERARLLGGTLEIASTRGSGTRLQITIPLG